MHACVRVCVYLQNLQEPGGLPSSISFYQRHRAGPSQGHSMSLHFQLSLLPLKLPMFWELVGHEEEQQTSLLEAAPPLGSVQRGMGSPSLRFLTKVCGGIKCPRHPEALLWVRSTAERPRKAFQNSQAQSPANTLTLEVWASQAWSQKPACSSTVTWGWGGVFRHGLNSPGTRQLHNLTLHWTTVVA